MKRILTAILSALAVLSMLAQSSDSAALSQAQWQHALAVIAQYQALNGGYGKQTEQFEQKSPQGYTLDDLDATYHGLSKWNKVYKRLKALENESGSMTRVKELAGKSLAHHVDRDMKKYLAAHPAEASEAVPTPASPADNADNASNLPPEPDTIAAAEAQPAPGPKTEEARSMPGGARIALDIVLALLALGALALAWATRRELAQLRRATRSEVETANANMQQLANDVSQHVKALHRRVGNIEANQRVTQQPKAKPESQADSEGKPAEKTYYLAKPDENDCFNRASEQFELGNSLFVLTTADGTHGTYQVIDNRDVHRFALMMPTENLTRACSGNAIQMSAGMTRVITDRPGEAVFENGRWRVVVKAIIHYEA